MSFFDALFGTNQTGSTDAATASANALIAQTQANNAGILNTSATNASGAINQGAAGATNAINQGYGAGIGALTNYAGQAQDALKSGVNQAVGTVQGSNANYSPYTASGGSANTTLANALGINGAAGNAAATSAFQASPGYAYQVQQASDAAARQAASLGIAGSGNTLDAITRLGSNLANQEYGSWLSNLSGLGSQGLTAANAVSANNQAAGGYQNAGGTTSANLLQQTGSGLGTLNAAQGSALGTIDTNQGTQLAGIQTGLGNALVGNNWAGTGAINTNSLSDAKAQDAATNTNNGIFSSLFGGALKTGLSALTL